MLAWAGTAINRRTVMYVSNQNNVSKVYCTIMRI
jgi:hypothetical protein